MGQTKGPAAGLIGCWTVFRRPENSCMRSDQELTNAARAWAHLCGTTVLKEWKAFSPDLSRKAGSHPGITGQTPPTLKGLHQRHRTPMVVLARCATRGFTLIELLV